MIQFYTVDELFNKQDIDEVFIASFNKLTESSQNIVKAKNLYLKEWLEINVTNVVASYAADNNNLDKEEVKFQEVETDDKNEAERDINCESPEKLVTPTDGAISLTSQPLVDNTPIKAEVALTTDNEITSSEENEEKVDYIQLLEKLNSEYKSLNFSKEMLPINNLYLVLLDKKAKNCPIHKKKLVKKKILMKVDGENKKTTLNACQYCKRFYFFNKGDEANKLKKSNIPYKLIKLEDIE